MNIDWEDHGFFAGQAIAGMGDTGGELPDWENPAVTGHGKLAPHAPLLPRAELYRAPFVRLLNGAWRFHLAGTPQEAPADFPQPDFDDRAWATIAVPGHWELQGFGQPRYTNIQYPFPADPPRVPADENPTGCYRTTFTIPEAWADREIILVFEGVDSACHVWVDGRLVGFSKGSRNPAEFCLTPLAAGPHTLAVRVYRWSDGSYLEDQDMWYLSGIFRDVYLLAMPPVAIRDVAIRARPNLAAGTAEIFVEAELQNLTGVPVTSRRLTAELRDAGGEIVATTEMPITSELPAAFSLAVPRARLWSPEDPYLYQLRLRLDDMQETRHAVGIRDVKVADGQLWVNGQSIKLRGINRHEWDGVRGRSLTEAEMRHDIRLIKQSGFNAVRCAHYPNHPRWYELCDAIGLFVIDEADLESHGLQDRLSIDPRWRDAYLDRLRRLVYRDRNHACVIAWSLGNEAGYGENIAAMAAEARRIDPDRPINYYHAQTAPIVDWIGMHYVRLDEMAALARTDPSGRPILLEEYAHAMGNAVGNLAEYWALIERTPRLIGGFIWQWRDLAIARPSGYAYGGDYGDHPNDGLWGVCGLLPPDGNPRPVLEEVRKVFQPCAVVRYGERLAITNRRYFTTLDDLVADWALTEDGHAVAVGALALPSIGPGQTVDVSMPSLPPAARPGERLLTIRFTLVRATAWAEEGFEVAWEQITLAPRPALSLPTGTPAVITEITGDCLTLRCDDLRLRWLYRQGRWFSLRVGARELFWDSPALCLWRAPLDTDIAFRDAWLAEDLHQLRPALGEAAPDGDGVRGSVLWRNPHGDDVARHTMTVRVLGARQLLVTQQVQFLRPLPTLPRIGLRLRLRDEFARVDWYGRGPHECLPDRCRGARIGHYACPVDALTVPYLHPQENGMRCDIRRLTLTADDGCGLAVTGEEPFTFTARRATVEDLAHAAHQEEVIRRPFIELCLDHRHAGTGNTTLRAERLPQYQVPAEDTAWQFLLEVGEGLADG